MAVGEGIGNHTRPLAKGDRLRCCIQKQVRVGVQLHSSDLNGDFDDVDLAKATGQSLAIDANSNKLLGFTQTVTTTNRGRTRSVVTTTVNYALDANGAMTTDGLRTFDYDATGRLAKVDVVNNGEAAHVRYLHNALGQRVFKSVPEAEQTLPDAQTLSPGFLDWLKQNFKWLFNTTSTVTSVGTAYIYDEGGNLLGEYDNGSALGKGRTEYIWLPTDSGQSMPIGFYRNGKFFAVHTDHLGTPRLVTDEAKKPVWQLPYSAFGNNKPTGVLQATLKPVQALTNQPVLLKATAAVEFNLRFPGQYFDAESNLNYNYFRTYAPGSGRYTQPDPIGLDGGVESIHLCWRQSSCLLRPTWPEPVGWGVVRSQSWCRSWQLVRTDRNRCRTCCWYWCRRGDRLVCHWTDVSR